MTPTDLAEDSQRVPSKTRITRWLEETNPTSFSAYCIIAAFTTYFCMYAFRKPFTAGEFADVGLPIAVGYKTILIAAQVGGYTLSKFIGIKIVSEMPAARRAIAIAILIAMAEVALLLFAIVPPPYNFVFLFLNGLPLGMVFGLVLAFLEGRHVTEALTAGLCASFIVASGVVKSVGRSLIEDFGVSEYWMPATTGLVFAIPTVVGVWLLSQIPKPDSSDVALRSERMPMHRGDRRAMFARHALGLSGLILVYVLLTIVRSIRDDFAVEIWDDLGYTGEPSVFAYSEIAVMLGVIAINGSAIVIRDNRTAFLGSFILIAGGFALVLSTLWGQAADYLSPFAFMVLVGLGTYVPYVAFHTTIFERFLAVFHERGNIGYLMYLADAAGYAAYVGLMVAKAYLVPDQGFLRLFVLATFWISVVSMGLAVALLMHYWWRTAIAKSDSAIGEPPTPLEEPA